MGRSTPHPGVSRMRVRVRGERVWQLKWKDPATGRPRTRVVRGTEAHATLEAMRQSAQLADPGRTETRTRPTEAVELFLAARAAEAREATLRDYRTRLARLMPLLPFPPAVEQTTPDILGLVRAAIVSLPTAASSRNGDVIVVRALCNWLRRSGRLPNVTRDDISDRMAGVRLERRRPDVLDRAGVRRLLEAVLAHDESPRTRTVWGPVVLSLLVGGFRLREVCGLEWEAVELEAERVDLERTKTDPRYVDLRRSPSLMRLFGRLRRSGRYVWRGGESLPPRVVQQWFDTLATRWGGPSTCAQQLRHTSASYCTAAFGSDYSCERHGHDYKVARRHYVGLVRVPEGVATIEAAMGVADLAERIANG